MFLLIFSKNVFFATKIFIMELSFIQSKIHVIRGVKVILDFDLAGMYGVENKYLKRAVRHNIERFEGEDFMFELTREEWNFLRCNFSTSKQLPELSQEKRGGIRYLPFAFTELGVAMLSGVLNSNTAIEVNRNVMSAFVLFRHYAAELAELKRQLEEYQADTTMQIAEILDIINEMAAKQNVLYKSPTVVAGFITQKK